MSADDPWSPTRREAAGRGRRAGGNALLEVDRSRETLLLTFNPSGYLRRTG